MLWIYLQLSICCGFVVDLFSCCGFVVDLWIFALLIKYLGDDMSPSKLQPLLNTPTENVKFDFRMFPVKIMKT